jgi:hypothetical protein
MPADYLQWRHCIEVDCGIALEPDFIAVRMAALTHDDAEPQRFARLYGEAHLRRVIGWFQRAQADLDRVAAASQQPGHP